MLCWSATPWKTSEQKKYCILWLYEIEETHLSWKCYLVQVCSACTTGRWIRETRCWGKEYDFFQRASWLKRWLWWWCLVAKSCPTLVTSWTVACQAPLSMGFSRLEYCTGLPFTSPWDLPDPGVKPRSPALQANSLPTELWGMAY